MSYYVEGKAVGRSSKEKIFYIRYKRNGKSVEEKAGRQFVDDMTPARAAGIRSQKIDGKQASNREKREDEKKKRWSIGDLWEEYRKQLSDGGKKADLSRWNLYLKDRVGNKEPSALVKLDTDRLRIELLKKKSPQTVKHVLALLKRIINFGVDRQLCQPITFKIQIPLVDNNKTEDLTPKELKTLLKTLEITNYKTAATIMKIALFTGMRRGEIFKLRWDDLDFQRGFIHIVSPKGGKSQKIPMNDSVREVFKSIREIDEYLFPARGGGPRKSIAYDARQIKEEAGLPEDFRPMHGLRHVYASMLASSGKVDMYAFKN